MSTEMTTTTKKTSTATKTTTMDDQEEDYKAPSSIFSFIYKYLLRI